MSFLAPLFLVGLVGLAIPILIHLIQRERKRVVEFPSLMFLRRIPYQSVRRRRIRNWWLLAMRLAALALIVAAYGQPFLRRPQLAAAGAAGAREIVVLLDRSYSMGYQGRWERARSAARNAVLGLGSGDRASVVFFDTRAEVAIRSTSDQGRLLAALDGAAPGPGATRYGPALKLAGSLLSESALARREALLVTDFQRVGWTDAADVRLPDGATLTPVSVGDGETTNVAVTPVSLARSTFSNQERVAVAAGAINRSSRAVSDLRMTLEVDGRAIEDVHVSMDPNGSASATFAPLTIASPNMRGTVRVAAISPGPPSHDALSADNAFHFVVSPAQPVRVLLVERPGARREAFYVARALAIGDAPRFELTTKTADAFSDQDVASADVIMLNDVAVSPLVADRLARFVQRGGGLLVALGERASWPPNGPDILPGILGSPVDRSKGPAGRIGALEYGHPVFEPFRAPRSGDFSTARFYGYRAVDVASEPLVGVGLQARPANDPGATGPHARPEAPPAGPVEGTVPGARPTSQVLARFDDGLPALVERRVASGRVLMWTSTFDLFWNDLALKPVFLPFVHVASRHLASYAEATPWLTVGQVLDPERNTRNAGGVRPGRPTAGRRGAAVVLAPSGRRLSIDDEGPDVLELTEPGFYEIRGDGAPITVASNVDLAESDLTAIDPKEVAAAVAGRAGGAAATNPTETPSDEAQERAQRVWWSLLFGALVLLGVETVLSNRLSGRNLS